MNKIQISECKSQAEWSTAQHFRKKYFFEPLGTEDPYTWTFDHLSHRHFVLYQQSEIIAYAHIQLWEDFRTAIRIIVVNHLKRNKGFGAEFLRLCEKQLKSMGYKSIHAESTADSLAFYKKNNYTEMSFNDPDGYESDPQDVAVGKKL